MNVFEDDSDVKKFALMGKSRDVITLLSPSDHLAPVLSLPLQRNKQITNRELKIGSCFAFVLMLNQNPD